MVLVFVALLDFKVLLVCLCCRCSFAVTNGFDVQISTWALSATQRTLSVQELRFSTLRVSRGPANFALYDRHKYKYLSIPDGSISFGTATQIDVTIIVGSVANGLNSSGFSALRVLPMHQRHILRLLRRSPSGPGLGERAGNPGLLDRVEAITIPSHSTSPLIYIYLRSSSTLAPASVSAKPPNPATPAPGEAPSFDIVDEQRLLQDLVDEALVQGVRTACARRLYGQEPFEARPNTRLGMTAGLSRKECERAAGVIKAAVAKVLAKRRTLQYLYHSNAYATYLSPN
ncbi:hypothetical protein H4582DRAFT_2058262 [Lactarius indigo]|nr:hypothetical protein H4582DRAFT_2058262 [Lactarius indigo]